MTPDEIAAKEASDKAAAENASKEQAEKDRVASEAALSEKIKGKSVEEVAKMYAEAERKMGEMSGEVGKYKETIQKFNVVLAAIGKNDERGNMVKSWVKELADEAENGGEDKGKKKDEATPDPTVTDVKLMEEGRIIKEFEGEYGISRMTDVEKESLRKKLGTYIKSVADPLNRMGKPEDVVKQIPVSKLRYILDQAYNQMAVDQVKADKKAGKTPDYGMVGMISSHELPSQENSLSKAEKHAAEKMHISEEDYLANKKKSLASKKDVKDDE